MSPPRRPRKVRAVDERDVLVEKLLAHPAFVERVAAAVLAQLGLGLQRTRETVEYSTRKGEGPPGYPDRAWKLLASRIGRKRGRRWYYVTQAELEFYEQSQKRAVAAPAVRLPAANDGDSGDELEQFTRELAVRLTRSPGRAR